MKFICKKKYIRRIMIILLSCFIFMMGMIFYLYFNAEQVQNRIKEKVCAAVLKHEDDLLATISACKNNQKKALVNDDSNQDSENCYYKELNSRTVNKVFKKFRLSGMYCGKNDLVEFLITPTIVSSLRDTYLYGFYYTADNQPMMTFKGIECDADIEIEDILYGGRYWYRTEKIDDHWYFYQAKVKFYNKSKLL